MELYSLLSRKTDDPVVSLCVEETLIKATLLVGTTSIIRTTLSFITGTRDYVGFSEAIVSLHFPSREQLWTYGVDFNSFGRGFFLTFV